MLEPQQITALFESLATNQPRLREYLQAQLDEQFKVLTSVNDTEQLRRAQGKAQSLQNLIGMLDGAKERLRKS
jgi:hypothetical protein